MCSDCGMTTKGIELLVDIAEGRRQPTIIPRWFAQRIVADILDPKPLIYSQMPHRSFAIDIPEIDR